LSFTFHKNSRHFSSQKRVAGLVFVMEIVLTLHCTCKLQVVSRAVLFAVHISQCIDEAASWNTEESEFDSEQGHEMFLLCTLCRPVLWPTPPPLQWALHPGLKQPGL